MVSFFIENLKGCDVIEVFLEDIAAHLNVMPERIVAILASRAHRRWMENLGQRRGCPLMIRYQPGVLFIYRRL
jgi:hypothetical protein